MLFGGCIGIMEKRMEALFSGFRALFFLDRGYIRVF